MKKIILLTCILLAGIFAVHAAKEKNPVQGVWRMDIYYFKLAKEFLGANLEIYSADGVKLFTQKVERRKSSLIFILRALADTSFNSSREMHHKNSRS